MSPPKVLIVDHHILARRAFTNVLEKDNAFNVVWVPNELQNIEKQIQQKNPDVVLLNVESMDSPGFTILTTLRIKFPYLPVIVTGPRTGEGAEAAITSLRLGALDFITKPEHKNLILFADNHLEKRLPAIINAALKVREGEDLDENYLQSLIKPQQRLEESDSGDGQFSTAEVVVIGGCTGGVQTLFTLVRDLPSHLKVPVIIVQHLPRTFSKILAEKLNAISDLPVREAREGINLHEGGVWIAPGGYQSEIVRSGYEVTLNIHRGLRENDMRPAIDVLFRSASRIYREKVLGVLLSGCGVDGLRGAEEIRKTGGTVIVQDPRDTLIPELVLSALEMGSASRYFNKSEMGEEIARRVSPRYNYKNRSDDENSIAFGHMDY